VFYNRSATHGGIVFVLEQVPSERKLVELEVNAVIGERRYSKTLNIILDDDAVVIHSAAVSPGVQATLADRFNAIYGPNTAPTYFFKSDLFSLHGTLDFSAHSQQVGTVFTASGQPLIKYMPNITGLIFDGCSNVTPTGTSFGTYDSSTKTLTFEALPNLTTLSFANCNASDTGILDLTGCENITSLDLRGTQVGIKLANSKVSSLQLGSPISVSITNPRTLGESETTFTI
jgi:hypothetical protein